MQVHLDLSACRREDLQRVPDDTDDVRGVCANLASKQLSCDQHGKVDDLVLDFVVQGLERSGQRVQQAV